jgi:hypothetical protein
MSELDGAFTALPHNRLFKWEKGKLNLITDEARGQRRHRVGASSRRSSGAPCMLR